MATQTEERVHSTTETGAESHGPNRSILWWAAGAGAAAGILTLTLRRKESRWDKARKQAGKVAEYVAEDLPVDLAEIAVKQWKPLVGIGAAAGTAAIIYSLRPKTPGWQKAIARAGQAARETEIKPWMTLAASTAISVASAYNRRKRARRLQPETAVEGLASGAMSIVNRARRISREVSKLYPQIRKAMA